jgi:hypothetical protein
MDYFNWEYYVNTYADLRKAGINNKVAALQHWVNHGLKEKRRCNKIFENFNWEDYLSKHPELKTKHNVLLFYYKDLCLKKSNDFNEVLLDKIKKLKLDYKHFNINNLFQTNLININTSLKLQPIKNILSNPIIKQSKNIYTNDKDVKIIICSCVYKRLELSKFCINEWLKLDVYKVIIAYSFDEDYENLKDLVNLYSDKLVLVKYPNLPLSNKWNQSVYSAKQFNPDAVMIMGSDDIFIESYLNKVKYYINRRIEYISNTNWANLWYFADKIMISTERYIKRATEDGLGSGRVINSSILNKINWNLYLFDTPINKCLDMNSFNKISKYISSNIFNIDNYSIFLLKVAGDNTAITVKGELSEYIQRVYRTNNFIKTVDNIHYLNYNNL